MKAKPLLITQKQKELLQTDQSLLPIAFYVSSFTPPDPCLILPATIVLNSIQNC